MKLFKTLFVFLITFNAFVGAAYAADLVADAAITQEQTQSATLSIDEFPTVSTYLKQLKASPFGNAELSQQCCKVCRKGKACGDSCIAKDKTCHKSPGCACDG